MNPYTVYVVMNLNWSQSWRYVKKRKSSKKDDSDHTRI